MLAFVGICGSFMQTIVVPMQARLPVLLGASREETAWVITATVLVGAVVTPVAGRLGDMYGKRRVALVLLGAMVAGSLVAALSHEIVGLIVGRALQGFVLGVVPLGIAILRDLLPRERLAGAIALVSASVGIGAALGLPLSAVISSNTDWHVVFWMAAGLGALSFVLVITVVPDTGIRFPERLDIGGAAGLVVGLTGLLLAISWGHEWGWLSAPTLGFAGGGVLVLLLWGWYELRIANPLVDLRLLRSLPVLLTNFAGMATGFAFFTSVISMTQLLELPTDVGSGLGLTTLAASLVIMPHGVVMLLMSPVAARLSGRIGPRRLLGLGAAILTAVYAVALFLPWTVLSIFVLMILIGVGIAFGFAASPLLIMAAVPTSQTAAANGINSLMRSIGSTLSSAVVGAVLAATSISIDGEPVPSSGGFTLVFAIAGVCAAITLTISFFIPRIPAQVPERRREAAVEADSPPGGIP